MLETLTLSAAFALSGLVGGLKAPPGTLPASAVAMKADTQHPVIVHIVSRDKTLTVKAGQHGMLYSLTSKEGKVLIADATQAKFAELQPEMFRQIRQYMAVATDQSNVLDASVDTSDVIAAIGER